MSLGAPASGPSRDGRWDRGAGVGKTTSGGRRSSNDVRLVDPKSHQVNARVFLDLQDSGVIGFPIAAATIPGQDAVAVVQDHGGLLRVDLASQKVSLIANLVPNNGEFATVTGAAFSSNGEAVVALATSNHDRSVGRAMTLLVVNTTSGRIQGRWLTPSWYGIGVPPDGRSVYARGDRGDLERLDLTSGAVKPFSSAPRYTWFHLIFPGQ
jgi:hypothetical protein